MSATRTSSRSEGIDLPTLAITAVASATAAYITSEIWAPGTLASAAITPVIVALVKEGLAKPTDVVTRAVPVRGVVRSAARADDPYDPIQPLPPEGVRVPQAGEIPGSSRALPRRAWRLAVITGLLGFVVAAVIITVPEFVAGKSVLGGDRSTTLFDSDRSSSSGSSAPATTTSPDDENDGDRVEPTVSVPPVETTTVPPADTTTVAPAQTTTAPVDPAVPDPAEENIVP